jgi:hypothetical protein
VTTAVFLLNRTPTKALSGKTPFEAYHGRKPTVGFPKTFVRNKRPGLKKLDNQCAYGIHRVLRGSQGVPDAGTKYRARSCLPRRHLRREHRMGVGHSGDSAAQREFTVRFYTAQPAADNVDGGVPEEGTLPPSLGQAAPLPDPGTPPPVEQQALEFVTPIEDDEDRLDAFHNKSLVRYQWMDNIIGNDKPVPGQAQRVLPPGRRGRSRRVQEELQFIDGGSEPRTFAEA